MTTSARTAIAQIIREWFRGFYSDAPREPIETLADRIITALPGLGWREWMPIETAPKDGSCILLLSKAHTDPPRWEGEEPVHFPARCHIGKWNPEGDSWTDQYGGFENEVCTLTITGTWDSGGGWFQPNEVTHWQPLPAPPTAALDAEPCPNPLPPTGRAE